MALKLPTFNQQVEVTNEQRMASSVFHRWWQKVASSIEGAVATIETNVLEIQILLGLVEDTREIVDNGLNPDGTVKADRVLNSSILAGEVLNTPGGNITSSTPLTSGGFTWFDCGEVTPTMNGVDTIVRVDFDTEVFDNCKFMYRVQCDGVTIGRERGPISVNTLDEPGYGITRRHTPTAGVRAYTLQCAVNDANDVTVHDPVFDITENRNV